MFKIFPLTKANGAVFWAAFNQLANHSLRLVSNLILTRLLVPEAFGLMVLVNVFLVGITMFSDLGIRQALVQRKGLMDEAFLNTAWTIQVTRGVVLLVISLLLSWPFSIIYAQPELVGLISLCAISAVVDGFNPITIALSERAINLKYIVIADVLAQLVTLIITVTLAYYLRSVWALAFGAVTAKGIKLLLNYRFQPKHNHRLAIDPKSFSELRQFGQWIFGSTALTFFSGQGIAAIQGALISIEQLALLSLAGMLAWAPGLMLMSILQRVIFPFLSEKNRTSDLVFEVGFQKYKLYIYCICGPIFAGLSLFSGPIIKILYDVRYWDAGNYLALLALNGALTVTPALYQCALLAKGRSNIHFQLMSISAFSKVLGVLIGYFSFGVFGMIIAIGFSEVIMCFFAIYIARRDHIKPHPLDVVYFILILLVYVTIYEIYFSS